MKHKAVIVNDLFYKGCEPQWKCERCGRYAPVRLYNQKEFEETGCDDIKIIANILENAGAVQCIPSHEWPNSKHNVLTFNLPMGYYVEINFRKLAEAVYESGYRLCEGCEKVTE